MTEVVTEVWRRSERRGRELEELCVFERDEALSSVSGEGSALAGDMMELMRGSRIFRPDDDVVLSVFATGAGIAGAFGGAGLVMAGGFSFFASTTRGTSGLYRNEGCMEDGAGTLNARLAPWPTPLACLARGWVGSSESEFCSVGGEVLALGGAIGGMVMGNSSARGGWRLRFGLAETALTEVGSTETSSCVAEAVG